jgi:hypothetical protein
MAHTVKLSGRAQRYLRSLEEFGHIGPDEVDRLCLGAAELLPTTEEGSWSSPVKVGQPTVRRAAAMLLFSTEEEPGGALADDWPLLFS